MNGLTADKIDKNRELCIDLGTEKERIKKNKWGMERERKKYRKHERESKKERKIMSERERIGKG